MASIASDPNGRKRIQFIGNDGQRRSIRLGKASLRQAEAVKVRVEQLVSASILAHPPDDETSRWVASLEDAMHARLAAVRLVTPRKFSSMTLAAFIDGIIADRTDAKPRTIINMKQARTDLVAHFGESRPLRDVTEGDADEFWRYLLRRGLAPNTARRICGRAKQFYRVAMKRKLIQSNPFDGIKCHVTGNTSREFFVTRDMAQRVLDACPSIEWKMIFALSRYGGLRCPSETLSLRWADVDWERNRIRVRSPKTEHHEGKDSRLIPLFPELLPLLKEASENADPDAQYIVTENRSGSANYRTQLNRIIERAGLIPWPKLFHNLRSSRQTELAETYPIHVVCAWIGNSAAIAQKHYLQVTDEHFGRAIGDAAQNAAQSGSVITSIDIKPDKYQTQNRSGFPSDSALYEILRRLAVPPRGVEPLSSG